ncbi:MAG: class I SAM-dependent methyltransferase [Bdellovibrio bacteriovorus]
MSATGDPQHLDPWALQISRRLEGQIRSEIAAAGGLLPFDRFMELALYAPGLGYYVAGAAKLGPGGDFVTAPEVSPLFGACLANQCADALGRVGGGDILELGPGSGALAVQVLHRLHALGCLPRRYLLLEVSPDLRERQGRAIAQQAPALADRCQWLERLPEGFRGVVLANEVLDAMPVHRFRVGQDGTTEECFVRASDQALQEVWRPVRSPGLGEAVAALQAEGLAVAPGYSSEVNLRLGPWAGALADSLAAGLVLLVDYGYPRSAYYQPDRTMGTLMCHWRHQAHPDPYRNIGLQDITAHVDFSAVARAGMGAGLALAGFATQGHFLIGCGIDGLIQGGEDAPDLDLALQAKQLLLPTAMGERFKVLGLARGVEGPWRGFSVRDLSDRL